jgi:hypothetical protein
MDETLLENHHWPTKTDRDRTLLEEHQYEMWKYLVPQQSVLERQ